MPTFKKTTTTKQPGGIYNAKTKGAYGLPGSYYDRTMYKQSYHPDTAMGEVQSEIMENRYSRPITPLRQLESTQYANYKGEPNNDDEYYRSKDNLTLKTGKFNLATVPKQMVDDAVESANKAGTDPYDLLALIGQESTFAGALGGQTINLSTSRQRLVSGWNLASQYEPYHPYRFLADKQVPGVNTVKNIHGWGYDIEDANKLNLYLQSHPELYDQYKKKLQSQPQMPADFDYFEAAAKAISTDEGKRGYNPGDPDYINKLKKSKELLMKDPVLTQYVSSLINK